MSCPTVFYLRLDKVSWMPTSPGLAVSAPSSSCCQWRPPGSLDPSEVYLNDGRLNMKLKYKISVKKREKPSILFIIIIMLHWNMTPFAKETGDF